MYRKIKFWILRKFNDGEPSREEALWAIAYSARLSPRIQIALVAYAGGSTLEQIGNSMSFTRERARQLVRKAVRNAWQLSEGKHEK